MQHMHWLHFPPNPMPLNLQPFEILKGGGHSMWNKTTKWKPLFVFWHAVTAQWCGKAITTQFLLKVINGMLVNAERECDTFTIMGSSNTQQNLMHPACYTWSCSTAVWQITRKTHFWWNIWNSNLCAINLLTLFLLFTFTDAVKAFVLSAQPIDR